MNKAILMQRDVNWCVLRLPKPVKEILKKYGPRVCVAGGYVRACIAGEAINDVDIFAPNRDLAAVIAMQLAEGDASRIHRTDNARTIHGYRLTPQVIHRWTFQSIADALDSFDFTIACAAIYWDGSVWSGICDPNFYPDLAAKRLIYRSPVRDEEPGGSLLRVLKFYQRGYRIPLDSYGAVLARLIKGIDMDLVEGAREPWLAKIITGLMVQVDPQLDPSHEAHLPSTPDLAASLFNTYEAENLLPSREI